MAERLEESGETVYPGMVSEFESDDREPTLLVLLQYSRIAGVTINTFADDDEDLPDRLPAELNEWVMIRRDSDSTK
jgi:transcriptional regulator with XRE-family HTH domain